MVARLVECSDYDTIYGILTVENVSAKEVQEKIYEIKNEFNDKGYDGWCIDDVFEKFPKKWEWDFVQGNDVLEI